MSDLISRQAAIEALHTILMYRMGTDSNKKRLDDWINSLPPIQPKRGRWIEKYPVTSVCSECGFLIHDSKVKVFAFCPNCGCRMDGGEQ